MTELLDAIIRGSLTLRQARVALAIARHGLIGARRLAAVTGMDCAACRRALKELRALPEVWVKMTHVGQNDPQGVGQNDPQGVGQNDPRGLIRPTPHNGREALSDKASEGVWVNSTHTSGSGGSSNNTTTTTTTDALPVDKLAIPACLVGAQREAAIRMLRPVPQYAQALLDELAGRAAVQQLRDPLAYLRGLVQRAIAGQFEPEAGIRIAEAREMAQALAAARAAADAAHLAKVKRSVPPGGSLKALYEQAIRTRAR